MTALEFRAWPKTPRLNREIVVTEKIDGTNGAIIILPVTELVGEAYSFGAGLEYAKLWCAQNVLGWVTLSSGQSFAVAAQSRKRLLNVGKAVDNFGFASWVAENAEALVHTLGAGYHYGEWWGQGIQRGYNLNHKRFSLFNTLRAPELIKLARKDGWIVPGLDVVPVLYQGAFSAQAIEGALDELRFTGSKVSSGPDDFPAEGVIVYLTAARQCFKVMLEDDDIPKSLAEAA